MKPSLRPRGLILGLSFALILPWTGEAQTLKPSTEVVTSKTLAPVTTLKTNPVCGNHIVEGTEGCDDGGLCADNTTPCNGDADCVKIGGACTPRSCDGCDANCVIETAKCVTAILVKQETATVKAPETQYQAATQYQATAKLGPLCGNGVVEEGEACDDGRQCENGTTACTSAADCAGIGAGTCAPRDGDRCPSDCKYQLQPVTELSAQLQPTQPETQYTIKTEVSYKAAYINHCGNNVLETDLGERCDDGNLVDGDGCSSSCLLEVKPVYTGDTVTPIEAVKVPATQPETQPETLPETQPSDPCLTAGPVGSAEYACCQTYLLPFFQQTVTTASTVTGFTAEAKESFVCCVKNGGSLGPDSCLPGEIGCDETTCKWMKPECTVAGPSTVSAGDTVDFKVTDAAGLPFASFECKDSPAAPAPADAEAATAVLMTPSPGDYTREVYTAATTEKTTMQLADRTSTEYTVAARQSYSTDVSLKRSSTTQPTTSDTYSIETSYQPMYYTRTAQIASSEKTLSTAPAGQTEATYSTAVADDKTVTCTITGPGGTSDPCQTTVRVGLCEFSCDQPDNTKRTSVGLDASCKLLKKPDGSTCQVSVNGQAANPVDDSGLVSVPTDVSGVAAFNTICYGDSYKAQCGDKIEVAPVCNAIKIEINGADGTGVTAHEGDQVKLTVDSKGAKECGITANYQKQVANPDGSVTFGVKGQGDIVVGAVCYGGPSFNSTIKAGSNSLYATCPDVTIPVASPNCGNKILETGELCDDGNNIATDACVACQPAKCGDGSVQSGVEECDFGPKNDNEGPDCTQKCRLPVCGDGIVQKGIGEECDDGGLSDNDGCSSACAIERCGDGITQKNEACDGGKDINGQPCKTDCSGFEPLPPPETQTAVFKEEMEEPPSLPPPAAKEAAPPPTVAEIPWVPKEVFVRQPELAVVTASPAPVTAARTPEVGVVTMEEAPLLPEATSPPAAPPPSPDSQPVDECREQFQDTSSLDYKCCIANKPKAIAFATRGSKDSYTSETQPDAVTLTPEEAQICRCRVAPLSLGCPCLGKHQVEDLNACQVAAVANPADRVVFQIDESKNEVTGSQGGKVNAATNLCACAAPQPFDKRMDCAPPSADAPSRITSSRLRQTDLSLSCLYPDQVDFITKNKAATVVSEGSDYRITVTASPAICKMMGGTSPETQPETQPETRRAIRVEEKPQLAEEAPPEAIAAVLGEAKAPEEIQLKDRAVLLSDERLKLRTGEEPIQTLDGDRTVNRIGTTEDTVCTIVKPQCPCTPPETPTTQPVEETPPPPPPPLPPAVKISPNVRLCVSRWGDYEALCPETGETIALKEACPALTIQAFTSKEAYNLYNVAGDYYGKPNDPERKKKLMDALRSNLNGADADPEHPVFNLFTLGADSSEGATLVTADRNVVKGSFQKNALVLNDDGSLKVNDTSALQIFSGEAALTTSAAEGGSKIVAVDDLFKNESSVTATSGQTATIIVGLDAAAAKGGGCSLIR